jgi:hypothetical protein
MSEHVNMVGGGRQLGALPFTQTALTNTPVQAVAAIAAGTPRSTLLHHLTIYNPNAAAAYIQVFNKASGSVTLGTTVPDYVVGVQPTDTIAIPLDGLGMQFPNGVTLAATTTPTGAVAPASTLVVSGSYS